MGKKITAFAFVLWLMMGVIFSTGKGNGLTLPLANGNLYLPMVITPSLPGTITFQSDRDGDYDIYTVKPDGTRLVNLTNNTTDESGPAWSPDYTKIAFYSDRDGNNEIYTMNADGTGVTRLTNHPASDYSPAWSPDGARIVFYTYRDGDEQSNFNSEIYAVNADGKHITRLTTNTYLDYSLDWSPDGSQIAYCSFRPGVGFYSIYLMSSDGLTETLLTKGCDPAWSPDGQRIAFYNTYVKLSTIGINGTGIANPGDIYAEHPGWSPDGNYLIFQSWDADLQNYDVHIIKADGTGETNLTGNPAQDGGADWGSISIP